MPAATTIAFLVNPINPNADAHTVDVQAATLALGRQTSIVKARNEAEIDAAFPALIQQRASALLVHSDPLFVNRRAQLAALATRYRIPAIYGRREYVASGGLVAYGDSLVDAFRQAGVYTGRILTGC